MFKCIYNETNIKNGTKGILKEFDDMYIVYNISEVHTEYPDHYILILEDEIENKLLLGIIEKSRDRIERIRIKGIIKASEVIASFNVFEDDEAVDYIINLYNKRNKSSQVACGVYFIPKSPEENNQPSPLKYDNIEPVQDSFIVEYHPVNKVPFNLVKSLIYHCDKWYVDNGNEDRPRGVYGYNGKFVINLISYFSESIKIKLFYTMKIL